MTHETKTCTKCGETKPNEEFRARRRTCKACYRMAQRALMRRWREEQPEAARAAARRYREKHPEKLREAGRRYREERPEVRRRYREKYRAEDPEKYRALERRHREKYLEKYPEKKRAADHRDQAASLATARNHGKEWTGPELELAADQSRTALEVALALGRTFRAVRTMRSKIHADPRKARMAGTDVEPG